MYVGLSSGLEISIRMVAHKGTPASIPMPVITLPMMKAGAELATIHTTDPTSRISVGVSCLI
jgi:hypothetical protein